MATFAEFADYQQTRDNNIGPLSPDVFSCRCILACKLSFSASPKSWPDYERIKAETWSPFG
jgi:hypothetical protein